MLVLYHNNLLLCVQRQNHKDPWLKRTNKQLYCSTPRSLFLSDGNP